MNLWGYDRGEADDEEEALRELREVSVVADDPAELRRVAQFFAEAASTVEVAGISTPTPTGVWHLTGTSITGIGPTAGPRNRAT